jgi:CheY-like chemotaxis protein
MTTPRVLVVEDDDSVRMMLQEGLQRDGFEVVPASNVRDALGLIASDHFDVLLSDLHLPLAGDGFTLVSAMRHTHPDALTVILSGYPAVDEAMSAILSQADEIFTKPVRIGPLKELIRTRLAAPRPIKRVKPESVASILERERKLRFRIGWIGSGPGCGTDMYSLEPHGTHWAPPQTASGPRCSAAAGLGIASPNFRSSSRPWRTAAPTRLHRCHGGGRISYLAGSIFSTLQRNLCRR